MIIFRRNLHWSSFRLNQILGNVDKETWRPSKDGGLHVVCGPVVLNWTGDDLAPPGDICPLLETIWPSHWGLCVSHSVVSNYLQLHGLYSPGKNTGVGSYSLFPGSSLPRYRTLVSCIADRFSTCEPPGTPIVGGGGDATVI